MLILFILSALLAVFLLFLVGACILAPELADHEACQPAPASPPADEYYDLMDELQHIDTYA